jgi:putative intracellular protease/amidase
VALTGGAAGKKITVICRGLVRATASGAISMGARISSSTAGKVAAVAVMAAPGSDTYTTAAMQAQLDKTEQWIGRALTAATNDGDVIYALLSCIP